MKTPHLKPLFAGLLIGAAAFAARAELLFSDCPEAAWQQRKLHGVLRRVKT
jgi:hypothetical protein